MSTIVLVHGIASEQGSADSLEAEWLPALAGGVRIADHRELADRLWRDARPGELETRMAYYGDLFRKPGAQGAGGDEPADAEMADELALAWLRAAAERGSPHDRVVAVQALAQIEAHPDARAQGGRALLRPAIKGLTRLRWFAPLGIAAAGRFVMQALGQVTTYLSDDAVRAEATGRVAKLIGPETRLVIGHSLGSVVAYEALLGVDQPVAFITLGSPLGLRRVIYDRLRPPPPRVPPSVRSWTNIADVDDLVAVDLKLRPLFPAVPGQVRIEVEDLETDNGSSPHAADRYLVKKATGEAVSRAIAG